MRGGSIMPKNIFYDLKNISDALLKVHYLATENISRAVFLAFQLKKPLLIEGPAGVGKTELAKSLALTAKMPLIRLQCYEGLDEQHALYQWNYQKQLLFLQANQRNQLDWQETKNDIFGEEFLLARPLLKAFQSPSQAVLLIDEIDKADEEFESFLLEALSDYQLSIPEFGTVKAQNVPIIFLTSNNSRDLSDGLRRRCIHLYIDYPSFEQELAIVSTKQEGLDEELAKAVVKFVQRLRKETLRKPPSIAETLDWSRALTILGNTGKLDQNIVGDTLNLLLKYNQDHNLVKQKLEELLLATKA